MQKAITTLFLLIYPITISFAQEEKTSICPEITNKKAIETLEKVRIKKYEFKERMDFIKKVLEDEPDFAEAQYEMPHLSVVSNLDFYF